VMWLAAVHLYWPWSDELTLMTCRLPDNISLTRSVKKKSPSHGHRFIAGQRVKV
jgi:hypothetical protein